MADTASLPPPPADDRLTDAEFALMTARGAFEGLGRWELRGGRLHRLSPTYHPHARLAFRFAKALDLAVTAAGLGLETATECSIAFGGGFTPTADIVLTEGAFDAFAPGAAVRLVIEVAESSLGDDLGPKALAYAQAGLAEYIVLDVAARALHHHWAPGPQGYARRDVVRFGEPLPLQTLAGVTVDTAGLA